MLRHVCGDRSKIANDRRFASAFSDLIAARAAKDPIVAVAADNCIVATKVWQRKRRVGFQRICRREDVEHTVIAEDDIVATTCAHFIATNARNDPVFAKACRDLVVAAFINAIRPDLHNRACVERTVGASQLLDNAKVGQNDIIARCGDHIVASGRKRVAGLCIIIGRTKLLRAYNRHQLWLERIAYRKIDTQAVVAVNMVAPSKCVDGIIA